MLRFDKIDASKCLRFISGDYAKKWEQAIVMGVNDTAQMAATDMKEHSPVGLTGHLMGSTGARLIRRAQDIAYAGQAAYYAPFVNYGHHLRNGAWWEGTHHADAAVLRQQEKLGWRIAQVGKQLGL